MVISVLTRQTAIRDADEFQKRVSRFAERARPVLALQAGFGGLTIEGMGDGGLRETTSWTSMDDCRRYVREGGAAMVATIADAVLPTAPYPNGAWVRETREE